ncbi:MAG: plasmid recombination protein [Clostridiales bacterium]|nr:plasmid recombination protein [Clostridiales bacterium]
MKTPSGSYQAIFDTLVEEKTISTRGLKADARLFGELIFDVNSAYFHNHGGYEYARQFYTDVYQAAVDIVGGEQYILSAVMHADERNRAMSEALGQDVYHYHLHVVYIPVVEKQILWSKRCKDKSLVGTIKETIMQVSSSKKWLSKPALDEAGNPVLQKNGKALMKIRPKVRRIVGLTGTPSSNGLMDLFAEFKLLDMGERLGRFITQYRLNYFTPDRMNGQVVYSYSLRPGAEDWIYEKISDITISMRAGDHLRMPELVSSEYPVYLSARERSLYDGMKKDLILHDEENEVTAANAAALSNKLSQMANGAVYTDDGAAVHIHDRKLDALEDIIESANGKPLLVAYWFKHDLERIKERFPVRELKSSKDISDWNAGKIPVAVIHPASAGHGLNLQTGGSTLVWFGLTWSLELYQQTNARLWRQGQTAGTVVIQHIVTKGTIDEHILRALEKKDSTQSALIDAVKATL